jgi:septum site-determining protein MinC
VFVDVPIERQINIKGIREGLLVTLGTAPYDEIVQQLTAELAQKRDFLLGSKMVLQVGEWSLERHQLAEIRDLFEEQGLTLWTVLTKRASTRAAARDLGLATRLPGSHTDLEGNALPEVAAAPEPTDGRPSPSESEANSSALLIKETLRSGRSVYHEGDVVIVGDVNPGAEIIAGGNVIVWGRLRGLVHAGALGDESAMICALDLNPTQLRIANQIAVPPDENRGKPVPEQALVRSGQIVAEPWQSRK